MEFFINLIICTTKFIIISHETPLTNAVENHNYEIVKILLDHGVDFSVGSNNIAALDIAIKSHDDSLALMIAKKIQVVDIVLLVKVIEMNNIPLAKILIPKCDKIRLDSLVKLAARGNSLEILMLLIENGALSQRKPVEPLIIACRYNYIEIAKVLIQNGVNVNGTKYEKPLIISTQNNFFEISNLLIENGADVNCCLYKNNTPLFNACLNNNVELVKLLIEKGAHREIDHNDPLFEALSPDIVNLIQ
ncbi:ankyrin repeat protein, putative [Trichomonas vaginalis G3]|uniref:Ankyrin repeat protein, putative n=1 Tax=Trichomonas vaginalis (strain ATCC PRA-98 / G3) TaxID=412133 RepID=A2DIA8_TRIV3|nr:protein ubiquitination [Trichomonas vaginalis G3]EAY19904.1 ankyrin repeat protein, putative [Trichomonas vaginalis G3]KAI5509962.1 protein ubiquitination [Trichomonas vaginalis G3]|eukprot:XP_001580890.1 ankyrin repeat protein [Trichomonas vaginalis G3]